MLIMRLFAKSCFIFFIILGLGACQNTPPKYGKETRDPNIYHESVDKLTEVIVHDIFSPPVASRIYAYPFIASYEVMRWEAPSDYPSLGGQLNGFSEFENGEPGDWVHLPYAATLTFLKTARFFIFSEDKITEQIEDVQKYYRDLGLSKKSMVESELFADQYSQHILEWASHDNYKQTRSLAKFAINNEEGTWKPTPPAYMEGIEPHWAKIRTFVIDSSSQFVPDPPTPFDMEPGSPFYQEVMEVYTAVNEANEEQLEIANFWDCNPYKMNISGHVMHATKKITPGGHWVSIAGIAAKGDDRGLLESIGAYTLVSLALADGFIACWDEKYRSALIRPETVINQYIDESWAPILQTPPFPEYTSGHSVISTAASVVLTQLYGDDFQFEDDTEVIFGLPVRSFDSFADAANEAAISRLYGGIHYRPAIDQGIKQGRQVGNFIIQDLDMGKLYER